MFHNEICEFIEITLSYKWMRNVILVVIWLTLISCGKVRNSSSADGSTTVGSAEFVLAKDVISSKCLSCHSEWTAYSEDDFSKYGLIFKGSPANSQLYIRIRGNDSGQAGDMPIGQPNVSVSQIQEIKAWIESL